MACRSYNVSAKETANRVRMSQSEEPQPPVNSPRKQTPRVPSNVLYDRIVPIALIIMALVLIAVVLIAVAGLIGAVR
jgi:lipopolysaccharide/colanic/teichoic acid biosynthesis glycosyltransferase